MMKVYTCEFKGYYPVGACAVIVADNLAEAFVMMAERLQEMGLHDENQPLELIELKTDEKQVKVLLDGNY